MNLCHFRKTFRETFYCISNSKRVTPPHITWGSLQTAISHCLTHDATLAVTTIFRHFRIKGAVTPAKELGQPSRETGSGSFFIESIFYVFSTFSRCFYCSPMRVIWFVQMSFSCVGPG